MEDLEVNEVELANQMIDAYGGTKKFAELLSVTEQIVCKWRKKGLSRFAQAFIKTLPKIKNK